MPDFYANVTEATIGDAIEITGDFIVEVLGNLKGGAAVLLRSQEEDDGEFSPVQGSILDKPGHYGVSNIGSSWFKGEFRQHNSRLGEPIVTMRYTQ